LIKACIELLVIVIIIILIISERICGITTITTFKSIIYDSDVLNIYNISNKLSANGSLLPLPQSPKRRNFSFPLELSLLAVLELLSELLLAVLELLLELLLAVLELSLLLENLLAMLHVIKTISRKLKNIILFHMVREIYGVNTNFPHAAFFLKKVLSQCECYTFEEN
jgi:hypothetical protein